MRHLVLCVLMYTMCLPQTGQARVTTRMRTSAAVNRSQATTQPAKGSHPRSVQSAVSGGYWREQVSHVSENLFSVWVVDADIAWASGDAGTVLRTVDGGAHWIDASIVPASVGGVYSIEGVSATTAIACVNTPANARLYRTTNAGASWTMVYQNTDPAAFMDGVHMFDTDQGVALGDPVGGRWVYLVTLDGGASWGSNSSLLASPGEAGWNNCFEWNDVFEEGWFGTNKSRIYTNPGGLPFDPHFFTPAPTPFTNSYTVSFATNLVGMTWGDGGATAISTNGGGSWSATPATAGRYYPSGVAFPSPRFWAVHGDSMFVTLNNGASWNLDGLVPNVGYSHIKMKQFAGVADSLAGYAVGTGGTIVAFTKLTKVLVVSPAKNALIVSHLPAIQATFSRPMTTASFNDATSFTVTGATSGRHQGTFSFSGGNTVATITPTTPFMKGEAVIVDISSDLQDADAASIAPFVYTFTVRQDPSPGTFAAKTDYGTGSEPYSVVVSDIDGDGDGDIVTANANGDSVSVLKNNGDGTFAAKTDYGTGSQPYSVVVSDIDGDGDGDIVTANRTGNNVSVLKNNGDGTFVAKTDYGTGDQPYSVVVSDIDGDGDGDIVTANAAGDSVSVLKNNDDGTFAAKIDYGTGDYPLSAVVSDIDGDGDGDVVAATGNNSVSVLKNNGDGTFAAKIGYGTGDYSLSVVVSDIDGDGVGDIVTANLFDGNVSVLKNNGDGTFAAKSDYGTGGDPYSTVVSDIDGDGDGDIVTANINGDNVSVLKNNGNGTFATNTDYGAAHLPYSVVVSDIDRDGVGDIVVANFGSNSVSVLKGLRPHIDIFVLLNQNWNLVSVPVTPASNAVSSLYPYASGGSAFAFVGGAYTPTGTMNAGTGYWIRYDSAGSGNIGGAKLVSLTIPVTAGWNLLGSISNAVAVASITSIPPGMTTSSFFGYIGSYSPADSIRPGRGYWVKTDQDGSLELSSVPPVNTPGRTIHIVASSEMPPPAPGGPNSSPVSSIPHEFALGQNYPNPFNPSTVIRYQLPVNSFVILRIYNVLGQEVRTLVDGIRDAGYVSASFDASTVASGIYFYKLEAVGTADPKQTFTEVRKMVLIR